MKSVLKISKHGVKCWRLPNGLCHREKDLPAIIFPDGTKFWYVNGKRHRDNGPAVERINGDKEWWFNNYRHRTNGPAGEYIDGTKYWWFENIQYTEEGYNEKVKDYKVEVTSTQENNSYSQGHKDGHSGLRWL